MRRKPQKIQEERYGQTYHKAADRVEVVDISEQEDTLGFQLHGLSSLRDHGGTWTWWH